MNNLNSVLLEGNLEADPVLSYAETGKAVCTFRLTVKRSWKEEDEMKTEESHFFIETGTRLAEVCAEHLKKGRGVRVVGRLKEEEGKTWILAEHVEFKPQLRKVAQPKANELKEKDAE